MRYLEYGPAELKPILLFHGGGLSVWNYREAARLLESDFHVVLPFLDGHAGSDRPFTTIEDNAEEVLNLIDACFGGSVLLIGGLSLGAQIALEILSERSDVCSCALIESASVIPSPRTNALIGPSVGMSYGWIRNRTFARIQFRSLRMRPEYFEDYYRDTCQIAKTDMIAFLKANTSYSLKPSICETAAKVCVFAGERETRGIRKSTEEIHRMIPSSERTVLPGLFHGEFSLNCPERYAETVRQILQKGQ
ncbi:MAG: alpha/beta hydrolase [Clostridia bacterium]|nr:alpha/beta hydrolase [Clostridia bacterium]